MKLSDFDYDLPEELIAIKPLSIRHDSKLLVYDGKGISDKRFFDLPELLNENDILVLNDTKVIPARLEGSCREAKAEITLLKKINDDSWEVLAKPAKKLVIGEKFFVTEEFYATILGKKESGEVTLQFNLSGLKLFDALHKYGSMPLPPYIAKKRKADKTDDATYQTSYAAQNKEGSVAAPTAGLHFTEEILSKLRAKKVKMVFITLHVGGGTFLPVRTENIEDHKMHGEYYEISEAAAEEINTVRKKGGRVIAVGTTSLRTLESASDNNGNIIPGNGDTKIFIYPGYKFKTVDALVTNFHLPKSTLFILVSAFLGVDETRKLYTHAINSKYRFFSYGDSSFLIRKP